MANIIHVQVENPDELLNAGAYGALAIVRLQSGAAEAGPFVNEATTTIVVATRSYTMYDADGSSATWYRTRYENAGGTLTSEWSAPFQTGDETGGLLCSIYDVEQELGTTLSPNEREVVIEKIRQVTNAIEGFTGRWFVPRPLSGDATYRFHTRRDYLLMIPKGIRSITSLSIATTGQPATGGAFQVQPSSTYYIDPPDGERDAGWPGTRVEFAYGYGPFHDARNGAEIVGKFGWSAVPYDIQGVATRAATRRYIGKSGGGVSVAIGPNGTEILLPDMSGADRATLVWYQDKNV